MLDKQNEDIEKFKSNLNNRSNLIAEAMVRTIWPYFAKRGWFISAENLYFNQVMALKKVIESLSTLEVSDIKNTELEIEEALLSFTREYSISIEKKVCDTWSKRKDCIQQAFWAHNAGKYVLSIPVFLAQSDGICLDIFGCHLFSKFKGNIKSEIERLNTLNQTQLTLAFLNLLTMKLSLCDKTNCRNQLKETDIFYGPINRHGILHGEDLDYHTEANSLRCISLLSFLAMISHAINK